MRPKLAPPTPRTKRTSIPRLSQHIFPVLSVPHPLFPDVVMARTKQAARRAVKAAKAAPARKKGAKKKAAKKKSKAVRVGVWSCVSWLVSGSVAAETHTFRVFRGRKV